MIEKLTHSQLRMTTDDSLFGFSTSDELTPAKPCTGQKRAVAALQTALAMPGAGYHVIVVGREGTDRQACLDSVLNSVASSRTTSMNKDRVLLPVSGRPGLYEEVQLQPGHARSLTTVCQQVVMASMNHDPDQHAQMMQELTDGFSDIPRLSEYINWLDNFSLLLMTGENTEFEYRELQRMIPIFLHAGSQQAMPFLWEPFADAPSLLGVQSVEPDTGRSVINAGTLIQASNGFLIIDGRRLIEDPLYWNLFRDILKSGLIPLHAIPSAPSSQACGGQPLNGYIRLLCRVVMLCDPDTFDQLQTLESDLDHLFPVIAEFESDMERNNDNTNAMAGIISALIRQYHCLPLNRQAMAAMIDIAALLTGTQHRLTLSRSVISRMLREASLLANMAGKQIVTDKHINAVIQQSRQRVIADRQEAMQAILNGETQVELAGKVIGQINGLTMVGSGLQSYLEPARITAAVRPGDGAVVDIEREVNLGGSIHSKGVLILTSLLASRYSRHTPLSLIASLVFEQSYAYVDGDSASAAEIMAILSAIAEIPLAQNLALTGSIDQRGQILCVGDINKKIEGFYDLCQLHGKVVDAGVVIPKTNLRDLMLDDNVIKAVDAGRFSIHAVTTLDDVIELYTGMKAGQEDDRHEFPAGSFNALVQEALKQFAEENKHDHKDD